MCGLRGVRTMFSENHRWPMRCVPHPAFCPVGQRRQCLLHPSQLGVQQLEEFTNDYKSSSWIGLIGFFFSWRRDFAGFQCVLPACMTSPQSIEIVLRHPAAGSCCRVLRFPQVHFKDGPVTTDKCEEANRLSRFPAAECFSTWGYFGPPGNSWQW